MRGWTILVLVVLGGWFIIVGPLAILEPSVRAVPNTLYDLIGWLYFSVFAYPGKWVLLHIWSGFFSLTWPQFFHGAGWGSILLALFAWSFALVFSSGSSSSPGSGSSRGGGIRSAGRPIGRVRFSSGSTPGGATGGRASQNSDVKRRAVSPVCCSFLLTSSSTAISSWGAPSCSSAGCYGPSEFRQKSTWSPSPAPARERAQRR